MSLTTTLGFLLVPYILLIASSGLPSSFHFALAIPYPPPAEGLHNDLTIVLDPSTHTSMTFQNLVVLNGLQIRCSDRTTFPTPFLANMQNITVSEFTFQSCVFSAGTAISFSQWHVVRNSTVNATNNRFLVRNVDGTGVRWSLVSSFFAQDLTFSQCDFVEYSSFFVNELSLNASLTIPSLDSTCTTEIINTKIYSDADSVFFRPYSSQKKLFNIQSQSAVVVRGTTAEGTISSNPQQSEGDSDLPPRFFCPSWRVLITGSGSLVLPDDGGQQFFGDLSIIFFDGAQSANNQIFVRNLQATSGGATVTIRTQQGGQVSNSLVAITGSTLWWISLLGDFVETQFQIEDNQLSMPSVNITGRQSTTPLLTIYPTMSGSASSSNIRVRNNTVIAFHLSSAAGALWFRPYLYGTSQVVIADNTFTSTTAYVTVNMAARTNEGSSVVVERNTITCSNDYYAMTLFNGFNSSAEALIHPSTIVDNNTLNGIVLMAQNPSARIPIRNGAGTFIFRNHEVHHLLEIWHTHLTGGVNYLFESNTFFSSSQGNASFMNGTFVMWNTTIDGSQLNIHNNTFLQARKAETSAETHMVTSDSTTSLPNITQQPFLYNYSMLELGGDISILNSGALRIENNTFVVASNNQEEEGYPIHHQQSNQQNSSFIKFNASTTDLRNSTRNVSHSHDLFDGFDDFVCDAGATLSVSGNTVLSQVGTGASAESAPFPPYFLELPPFTSSSASCTLSISQNQLSEATGGMQVQLARPATLLFVENIVPLEAKTSFNFTIPNSTTSNADGMKVQSCNTYESGAPFVLVASSTTSSQTSSANSQGPAESFSPEFQVDMTQCLAPLWLELNETTGASSSPLTTIQVKVSSPRSIAGEVELLVATHSPEGVSIPTTTLEKNRCVPDLSRALGSGLKCPIGALFPGQPVTFDFGLGIPNFFVGTFPFQVTVAGVNTNGSIQQDYYLGQGASGGTLAPGAGQVTVSPRAGPPDGANVLGLFGAGDAVSCTDPLVVSWLVFLLLLLVATFSSVLMENRKNKKWREGGTAAELAPNDTWLEVPLIKSLLLHHTWVSLLIPCHPHCCINHLLVTMSHHLLLLMTCAILSLTLKGSLSSLLVIVALSATIPQVMRPLEQFFYWIYEVRQISQEQATGGATTTTANMGSRIRIIGGGGGYSIPPYSPHTRSNTGATDLETSCSSKPTMGVTRGLRTGGRSSTAASNLDFLDDVILDESELTGGLLSGGSAALGSSCVTFNSDEGFRLTQTSSICLSTSGRNDTDASSSRPSQASKRNYGTAATIRRARREQQHVDIEFGEEELCEDEVEQASCPDSGTKKKQPADLPVPLPAAPGECSSLIGTTREEMMDEGSWEAELELKGVTTGVEGNSRKGRLVSLLFIITSTLITFFTSQRLNLQQQCETYLQAFWILLLVDAFGAQPIGMVLVCGYRYMTAGPPLRATSATSPTLEGEEVDDAPNKLFSSLHPVDNEVRREL